MLDKCNGVIRVFYKGENVAHSALKYTWQLLPEIIFQETKYNPVRILLMVTFGVASYNAQKNIGADWCKYLHTNI